MREYDDTRAKHSTKIMSYTVVTNTQPDGISGLYKGYLNLSSVEVDIRCLDEKKRIFLFFVFLECSHGFLSLIFELLDKFWVRKIFFRKI